MRNTRPSWRTSVPRVDQLEPRQLLSTTAMPVPGPVLAPPHHGMRVHHAAIVERVHSSHHGTATPAAAPAPPAPASRSSDSSTATSKRPRRSRTTMSGRWAIRSSTAPISR